jgi:diadenylate cyclase
MPLNTVNLFELAIIAITIYVFYIKYIKGTQSEKLLKGIFMLLIALLLSKFLILLKLQILGKFLESLVSIVIFGLVVIFQPELRRFLGYLGQPGFLSKNLFHSGESTDETGAVEEITEAIKYLGKSRTGALIVLQNTFEGTHYFEVGTKLNAQISTELILTIFHPNTALHDGAMVIKNNKILSAGVLLPLTEDPKLSWQYGTRHRAAIGMTEISDAVCIVVSEETGHVSISQNGLLTKIETIDELKEKLNQLYGINTDETVITKTAKKFSFNNIFFGETNKFPGILEKKDIINK